MFTTFSFAQRLLIAQAKGDARLPTLEQMRRAGCQVLLGFALAALNHPVARTS